MSDFETWLWNGDSAEDTAERAEVLKNVLPNPLAHGTRQIPAVCWAVFNADCDWSWAIKYGTEWQKWDMERVYKNLYAQWAAAPPICPDCQDYIYPDNRCQCD